MRVALALFAMLFGCASEPPASCGAIGRVEACPCPGGAQGAQECGPLGVWTACACPGADAGPEAGDASSPPADGPAVPDAGADGPDVAADVPAPPDGPPEAAVDAATDATPVDAPSRPCSVASDCGTLHPGWAPSCQSGRCVDVCPAETLDCDGDAANGCEARATGRLSCGACGRVCPSRCTRFDGGAYVCT